MRARVLRLAFTAITVISSVPHTGSAEEKVGPARPGAGVVSQSTSPRATRSPKDRVEMAAWTLGALAVATCSSAGIFALQAQIEDRRNDAHPSGTFRDRRDRRRALSYGFLGLGAMLVAGAVITGTAAFRMTENKGVSLALAPLDNGGFLSLDLRF